MKPRKISINSDFSELQKSERFLRFSIVASRKDEAGMNIASFLELPIHFVDYDIVYAENIDKQLDKDTDFIIFISKHQGKQGKMLSIHAPGNFKQADFGGKENRVCKTSAFILKTFFINLNKNLPASWQATLEVTHHGPYINKPCLFIEIGSSQQDWQDKEAAQAIANTIKQSIEKINQTTKQNLIPAIGIASPHYCPNFNLIQFNSEYALSHIIPSYVAPITKEMIQEAINKTQEKVQTAIIDWKSLKGEQRQACTRLLNQLSLKILRTSQVKK